MTIFLFYLPCILLITQKGKLLKDAGHIDIGIEKLFILLYADEIVHFQVSVRGLQITLDILT